MYPEMPWMITSHSNLMELRDAVAENWGSRAAWRTRLFAFGYDACQLMLAMSTPAQAPAAAQIDGLTGQLHFDADRRIQRDLIWVRVDRKRQILSRWPPPAANAEPAADIPDTPVPQ